MNTPGPKNKEVFSLVDLRRFIYNHEIFPEYVEVSEKTWFMLEKEMAEAIKDTWGIPLVRRGIDRPHFLAFGIPIFIVE